MPCYYTGTAAGDARLEASEANQALTKTTAHLCSLCRHIEDTYEDDIIGDVPGLKKWWKEHKAIDERNK